jgi:hypothetical protein
MNIKENNSKDNTGKGNNSKDSKDSKRNIKTSDQPE